MIQFRKILSSIVAIGFVGLLNVEVSFAQPSRNPSENFRDLAQLNTSEVSHLKDRTLEKRCLMIGTGVGLSLVAAGLWLVFRDRKLEKDS